MTWCVQTRLYRSFSYQGAHRISRSMLHLTVTWRKKNTSIVGVGLLLVVWLPHQV